MHYNVINRYTVYLYFICVGDFMLYSDQQLKTCCFFGHRKIVETTLLREILFETLTDLIVNHNVSVFLFGSRSKFNDLCHSVVSELKQKHSFIKRIYVRAEYPYISDEYERYLLQNYEATYFPEGLLNSHKAVYIERNFEMIDKSKFCIVYYDSEYTPLPRKSAIPVRKTKSGTATAYEYARKRGMHIINVKNLSSQELTDK